MERNDGAKECHEILIAMRVVLPGSCTFTRGRKLSSSRVLLRYPTSSPQQCEALVRSTLTVADGASYAATDEPHARNCWAEIGTSDTTLHEAGFQSCKFEDPGAQVGLVGPLFTNAPPGHRAGMFV